jgi:cytochrome c oxidase assembly protein subunit 11
MLRHGVRRVVAAAASHGAPSAAARAPHPWSPPPVDGWRANTWTHGGSAVSSAAAGLAARGARARAFASSAPSSSAPPSSSAEAASKREASRQARAAHIASVNARARGSASAGGIYLLALAVGMVGATYASVPLYRMFCQATGFGGTTRRKTIEDKLRESESLPERTKAAASARAVTVSFNADVAEGMPWRFAPTQKNVVVRPGETTLAFFTAKNRSKEPVVGVATYNVQPNKAGSYFNKVQCFCFEEQRLRGGEEVDMPVFFYLDPEFATDPAMADVNDVILSYTFFRSDGFDETDEAVAQSGVRTHGPGVVPRGVEPHPAMK